MTVVSVPEGKITSETPAPLAGGRGRGPTTEEWNVDKTTAGPIGPDRREITVEPLPKTAPVKEPTPQREPEPVR